MTFGLGLGCFTGLLRDLVLLYNITYVFRGGVIGEQLVRTGLIGVVTFNGILRCFLLFFYQQRLGCWVTIFRGQAIGTAVYFSFFYLLATCGGAIAPMVSLGVLWVTTRDGFTIIGGNSAITGFFGVIRLIT